MTYQQRLNFSVKINFFFLFILSILHTSSSYAQVDPSHFVVVDYMKVAPENNVAYLRTEQELWKPMHTERIKRGIIVGWYLYAVQFAGTGNEYNYVVINVYDDASHLENPWNADIPNKIHPKLSIDKILERTQAVRETVKSELHYSIATAPAIPLDKPAPYMQVNYMQVAPQMQSEYEQIESEIWLPIHNQSIESGRTNGWGLWKRLFPRGTGEDYQYMTLNTFSDFSTILGLDFSVSFNEIHPGKNYELVLEKAQETRTIKRTELWDLIDYVIR
jgi:hypothetical protein